jgi:hypothetical protein
MSWKELAIGLAKEEGHATFCPFTGCRCGAVERRVEWTADIFRKMRQEAHESD